MNQDRSSGPRRNNGPRSNSGGGNFRGRSNSGGNGYRGGNNNFRRNDSPGFKREMHKAKCDECKQDCDVPFKPTEGKPVFCRDCYAKKRGY